MKSRTWVFEDAVLDDRYDAASEFASGEGNIAAALVLEEAFVNVANHAYGDGAEQRPCMVTVSKVPGGVEVVIDDVGAEFDPTAFVQRADGSSVGGHGIQVIREFSTRMEYSRAAGHNLLSIEVPVE